MAAAREVEPRSSSSAIDEALNAKNGGRGERGRGRGRGERGRGGGRGRGRGRGDIIVESTASGLFSLGPSAMASRARNAYSSGGGYATYGGDVNSRLDMYNTEASDVLNLFANNQDSTLPVVFPHISRTAGELDPTDLTSSRPKIPWLRQKSKETPSFTAKPDSSTTESDDENVVKKEPGLDGKMDVDNEDDNDDLSSLSPILMDDDAPAQNLFALDEKSRLVPLTDGELLFFQLPTIIPRLEAEKEDEEMENIKRENSDPSDKAKELPPAVKKAALEEAMQNLSLKDIPEGQIGSLIVYKSGKIKLKMGDVLFDVRQGMQSSFLENVMMVDTESEDQKKMIDLGHLTQKFVCMPDMDALLAGEEDA
ncbi:RNA polymerase III RPC4-domain-containing protein [Dichotomocladium elegans]|nr:RNA polymerase III RPC4-domain-containing protein [Dichotomocladium elegans]